jgi:hypothetical protein
MIDRLTKTTEVTRSGDLDLYITVLRYLGDQHVVLKALSPGRRLSFPVGHGMARRRRLHDRETNGSRSALAAVIHCVHHELRLLHRMVVVGVRVGAWLRVCRWRRRTTVGADDGYRNMICRHRNYLQSAVCPGVFVSRFFYVR